MLVIPAVFAIMSILLYKIYDSLKEALHVMLAVLFALTGGIFLLKLLGYNFSVAVWVGFIALFGTAVQTGVVMVIYLEEAVVRKKAAIGTLTAQGLHEAVMKGVAIKMLSGERTKYALVEMPVFDAESAIAELDGKHWGGGRLRVQEFSTKEIERVRRYEQKGGVFANWPKSLAPHSG
jgi:copper/silver efflux system protein